LSDARTIRWLAIAPAAAAALALACAQDVVHDGAPAGVGAAASPAAPPNVLLVCIDTLRADRLGCYGYARKTSPHLDRLAARGQRFERAYGTAPWTLPSTTSLLTGLLPELHRATNFASPVSPDAELLSQRLADAGYDSAAFVGNYFVQPIFGLAKGFASYSGDCSVDRTGVNSDKISDGAITWLAQKRERPFFLYLHYFDPHYNYIEHAGFTFGGEDSDRVYSGADIYDLREGEKQFTDADRFRLNALYDSEVAFTDHHLGRVFAKLDELGLTGKTLIVVTADHGEALAEHGWIGHTLQLYEESVRVPLIVAGPGVAPEVVPASKPRQGDQAERDLLARLGLETEEHPRGVLGEEGILISVDTVGIDEPAEVKWPKAVKAEPWKMLIDTDEKGVDSYRIFKMDEPKGKRKKDPADYPEVVKELLVKREQLYEQRLKDRDRHAQAMTRRRTLIDGSWKLIVDEIEGGCELYDLASDPHEQRDLAQENPETKARVAAMKERLAAVLADLRARARRDADPISIEALEAFRKKLEATGYASK